MVISQIVGGLGNQMFQYAAGFTVAMQANDRLLLDVSAYNQYKLHQGFELERVFCLNSDFAETSDIQQLLGWQSSPFIRRILVKARLNNLFPNRYIGEPHLHYWSGIRKLQTNCYLAGYWQSEKYFGSTEGRIRKAFSFCRPLEGENKDVAEHIFNVNAVSLHVRRGDYATNPKTNMMHGLCSIEYYQEAIKYLVERIDAPVFFIFSDDINWVKDNLKLNFPATYVQHNQGRNSYIDMQLMSLCQHNIIANSSFSWWGAWLNSNGRKIVIAPKHWFAQNISTDGLIPSSWVKL